MTVLERTGGFDMGRVIARTFGPIGRNFPLFFGLSLVLAGIPSLLSSWSDLNEGDSTAGALGLIGSLLSLVTTYILQAALVHAAVLDLRGQKARLTDVLSVGSTMFLPVLGLSILYGLAVGFGLLALIVPGLIMMTVWAVASPALVVERTGVFDAFSRSRNLTRDHRWSIFGLLVIYGIAFFLIMMLAVAIAGVFAGEGDRRYVILGVVIMMVGQTLGSMVGAAGAAAIYIELRQIKEGVGGDELAAVFA
jgi:hypothetical protein